MNTEPVLSSFDRMIQQALAANASFGAADDQAALSMPTLWRWLTSTDAGSEHLKEPAKLSIRATPGGFMVSLSDDSLGYSLDAAWPTLEGCLSAMEGMLVSNNPPWRKWPNHVMKVRKRPKLNT